MKKQLIVIHLGLLLSTSCFATGSLLPKFITEKLQHAKSTNKILSSGDGYADLSGEWTGTCESQGDTEEEHLTLRMSDDGSSVFINDEEVTIDAISSAETKTNMESSFRALHFHWSSDGQQLLSSGILYEQKGNLSKGGIIYAVTKSAYYLENEQLNVTHNVSAFQDGTLGGSFEEHCIYKKAE